MRLALKKNNNDDEAIGRSRGGLSSKIHCIVDGLGNPVDFILTGGEVHDSACADTLLNGKNADFVVADKGYDTNAILDRIAQMEAAAVIPPKVNRKEQRAKSKELMTSIITKTET